MTPGKEKARGNGQVTTGPESSTDGRQHNSNGPGGKPQGILANADRFRPQAEHAGRQLIRSWVDYGPKDANTIDPDTMPGILAEVGKGVLDAMIREGLKDFSGVLGYFTGAPDGIRSEFIECCQGNGPRPEGCGPLLKIIQQWHHAHAKDMLAARLRIALDNGDDPAAILREFAALEAETGTATGFPIVRASDITGSSEPADFVEGLLTEGGASVVYGPSNCGKSFWTLDLAAAVATGRPFRDELDVDQGAVVYVALEGSHGARNRIQALRQAGKLPADAPLFLCFAPVSLLELGHAGKLAATVKQAADESAIPCRLVILDTLARAMAGGDENKGQDMTLAVSAIDTVRAATGAHVLTVHHCGKDEAKGARGHSSLRAAVDTEIEVSRPEGETVSTVRATKQRDMPMGEPMPFSLKAITLGTDRRGKPITSCIVHHEDAIMAAGQSKAGRKPEVQPERLLDLLPQPGTAAWQKAADAEMGVSKSTFYRSLERLKASHAAKQQTGGAWDRWKP